MGLGLLPGLTSSVLIPASVLSLRMLVSPSKSRLVHVYVSSSHKEQQPSSTFIPSLFLAMQHNSGTEKSKINFVIKAHERPVSSSKFGMLAQEGLLLGATEIVGTADGSAEGT